MSNRFQCYFSKVTSPFLNLAIEDWLFRISPADSHILLFWKNEKCIVIGRNQNPWTECNIRRLKMDHVPLVRRKSGGGTVYHDLGNSIYSLIQPKSAFRRTENADLIAQALQLLGVPAEVNVRHDIVVDQKKVSGSAFKLTRDRAYHHGTMLIDSELDSLHRYLKSPSLSPPLVTSHAVASVPSKVTQLTHYTSRPICHEDFCTAVLRRFEQAKGCGPLSPIEIDTSIIAKEPMVKEIYDELKSVDWIYGQTPEFNVHNSHEDFSFRLHSKHGKIEDLQLLFNHDPTSMLATTFQHFKPYIIGRWYDHQVFDTTWLHFLIEFPNTPKFVQSHFHRVFQHIAGVME